MSPAIKGRPFHLLSSHGAVLRAILSNRPATTYRELALQVGMTERNVITVTRDLVGAGLVDRNRQQGRIRLKRSTTPILLAAALHSITNTRYGHNGGKP